MTEWGPDERFDDVRAALAGAPPVEPRPGALERIIAAVAAEPETSEAGASRTAPDAAVVALDDHRRTRAQRWAPRVAAAAVVLAVIGVVVGGVGTDTEIPAIGDLIASHEAAASETMPESAHVMPLDDAHDMEPAMPESMSMAAAYVVAGDTVQLVYHDVEGGVVSVFRQVGDTDLDDLGDAGHVEIMGDSTVWVAVVAEMHVAVIDGDGYVWTVVADHHDAEMMTVMTERLPSRSPSLLERVRDAADAVVDPWRFGA